DGPNDDILELLIKEEEDTLRGGATPFESSPPELGKDSHRLNNTTAEKTPRSANNVAAPLPRPFTARELHDHCGANAYYCDGFNEKTVHSWYVGNDSRGWRDKKGEPIRDWRCALDTYIATARKRSGWKPRPGANGNSFLFASSERDYYKEHPD